MNIAMETVDFPIQNMLLVRQIEDIQWISHIFFPSSKAWRFSSHLCLLQEHRSWSTFSLPATPGQPCGVRRPLAVAQTSRSLSELPRAAAAAANGRWVSRQRVTMDNGRTIFPIHKWDEIEFYQEKLGVELVCVLFVIL